MMTHKWPPLVFIAQLPTPQKVPVFDRFAVEGLEFMVIYIKRHRTAGAWGDIEVRHPHVFAEGGIGLAAALGLAIITGRVRLLHCAGHRGVVRASALLLARLSRTSVITQSDTNAKDVDRRSPVKRALTLALYRVMYAPSARIWTIGTANRAFWRDLVGRQNTVAIPFVTPVPTADDGCSPTTRRSDFSRMRLLFVGRLVDVKAVDVAITAFRRLTGAAFSEWKFSIVGSGPNEDALRSQAACDGRITFFGSIPHAELGDIFRSHDCLVLPSRSEPWGLVVNEALGWGLHVIVSDQVGAGLDIVAPVNGTVFPVDDVAALERAFRGLGSHLLQEPEAQVDCAMAMLQDLHDVRLASGQLPRPLRKPSADPTWWRPLRRPHLQSWDVMTKVKWIIHNIAIAAAVLRHVWNHPSNTGARSRAIIRSVMAQCAGRVGRPMHVPLGDSAAIRAVPGFHSAMSVAYASLPDMAEMRVWQRTIRPGDRFVDVGANVGSYTVLAASLGAQVTAVEPVGAAVSELEHNLAFNGLQARIFRGVLTDHVGSMTLVGDQDSLHHVSERPGEGGVTVSTSTLDVLIGFDAVAGMKIDVEGAERAVLRGGVSMLEAGRIGLLQLEWNSQSRNNYGYTRQDIFELVDSAGYHLYRPDSDGMLHPTTPDEGTDVFAARPATVEALYRYEDKVRAAVVAAPSGDRSEQELGEEQRRWS